MLLALSPGCLRKVSEETETIVMFIKKYRRPRLVVRPPCEFNFEPELKNSFTRLWRMLRPIIRSEAKQSRDRTSSRNHRPAKAGPVGSSQLYVDGVAAVFATDRCSSRVKGSER